jgi:DNA (cytosine-5)-methyltransferase 1
MAKRPLTFGSLFAGIGGFDLGFERAGMACKWQVERNEYASRVLARHWPDAARWGEVETFPPNDGGEWRVDVICAGVPCQPVSVAGKQLGKADERWMWGECLRVVATLRPRFFVAENPPALLSDDGGRTFAGIVSALQAAGYGVDWHTIAAADLGAPHRRARVFLVARQDASMGKVPVLRGLPMHDTREARHGLPLPADRGVGRVSVSASATLAHADSKGLQGAVLEHSGEGLPRPRNGTRRDEEQKVSEASRGWWQAEPAVGRVAHGISHRVDRLRCLGNAAVPQITELVARAILEAEAQMTL